MSIKPIGLEINGVTHVHQINHRLQELIKATTVQPQAMIPPRKSIVPLIQDQANLNLALGSERNHKPFAAIPVEAHGALPIKTILPFPVVKKNIVPYDLGNQMQNAATEGEAETIMAGVIGENRFIQAGRTGPDVVTRNQQKLLNRGGDIQENIIAQAIHPQEALLKEILIAIKGQTIDRVANQIAQTAEIKAPPFEEKYDSADIAEEVKKIEKELEMTKLIKEAPKPPSGPPGPLGEADPDQYDFSLLNRYKLKELIAYCRLFDLPVSGKKADLIARLSDRQEKLIREYVELGNDEETAKDLAKTLPNLRKEEEKHPLGGHGLVRASRQSSYLPFGAYRINETHLKRGILSLAHKGTAAANGSSVIVKKVVGLPNRALSREFQEALIEMIDSAKFPDISDLTDEEKEYFYLIVAKAHVDVKMTRSQKAKVDSLAVLSAQGGKHTNLDALKQRFAILVGETTAGNTGNPQIKAELRRILNAFLRQKVITPVEYRDLLLRYV